MQFCTYNLPFKVYIAKTAQKMQRSKVVKKLGLPKNYSVLVVKCKYVLYVENGKKLYCLPLICDAASFTRRHKFYMLFLPSIFGAFQWSGTVFF